jgi:hypothetical protein
MKHVFSFCFLVAGGMNLLFAQALAQAQAQAQVQIHKAIESRHLPADGKKQRADIQSAVPATATGDHAPIHPVHTKRVDHAGPNGKFAATATLGLRLSGRPSSWQQIDNWTTVRRAPVSSEEQR